MPDLKAQILDALRTVNDPELHKDLVTLNMVKRIEESAGDVVIEVELTTPACPLKGKIEGDVRAAVSPIPGIHSIAVQFSANVAGRQRGKADIAPGVRNIIGVGSGKGGVGKSTVAVNLALSLRRTGARVGLIDADIYGPNVPKMLGVDEQPRMRENKMIPPVAYGIKVMSMGFLIDEDQPVMWRGPMLDKALMQFFGDCEWGEIDYLIVDMPPGTGDVQISLCQKTNMTGAVIVSTPQTVSLLDARKAITMFRMLKTPVLGMVENMSYFICPHGSRVEIFDHGGVRRAADQLGLPFLGEIALDTRVRVGGDAGRPIVDSEPDSDVSLMFLEVAKAVAAQASVANLAPAAPAAVASTK